ncbi:hypothetical protein [Nitrosophilus alvini]|uniref:hypothetical protein n=1 Tax=Nitrosophilus alvini TaxID=2714855 RepID=UPI00190BD00E|nr:hypothetical protein [Nitrosophilus alvini]
MKTQTFREFRENFLNFFRELFLYHYSSLKFRAKVFAIVISANKEWGECEMNILQKAAVKIYDNQEERVEALISAVKDYINELEEYEYLGERYWIADIKKDIAKHKRFIKKIDIQTLKEFGKCVKDKETRMYQQRVIEFLENLKKEFGEKNDV